MLNSSWIFLSLLLCTVLCQAEVFKPARVTASSFVITNASDNHRPETIADGVLGSNNAYWASDFKSSAKPPHWLEFEYDEAITFNEIKLNMVERYSISSLLNSFALEYWDGKEYRTIIDKPKYISEFRQAMVSSDWDLRYGAGLPTAHPVFRFSPITASKVRVVIRDSLGRLDEMTVAFNPGGEKKQDLGLPVINVAGNQVRQFVCVPPDYTLPQGVERMPLERAEGVYFCDRLGPDGFRRFFAVSKNENTVRIELSPGYYDVFALSGDFCTGSPGCSIKVQDRTWQYRQWVLPGNPEGSFFWDTFTIQVMDSGVAEFKLLGEWLLNGLLIAPVQARQDFLAAVDKLMLGNQAAKFVYRAPETNTVELPPTEQERAQGFITFNPPKEQRIFPQTTPLPEQRTSQLQFNGAAGQRLALSVAFRTLQDIPNFQLVAGVWKDSAGRTWPAAVTAVHPIRVWPQRTDHKGAGKLWNRAPELLAENSPRYLVSGTTQQYYLMLDLPQDAAPGSYQSTVSVMGEGCPTLEIPLTLEVHPFSLADIDDMYFAMYNGDANFSFLTRPENREGDILRLRDMRRHNMNSVIYPQSGWTSAEDFSACYQQVNALLDECGFPRKPMPYHNSGITADITSQVKDIVQKTGLREILFYPVDEPFSRNKLEIALQLYPEVKKVPGVRTYSTVTQNCVDKLGASLDICCYTITGYAKFQPDRIREEFARTGQEFWWYSNGAREYPAAVRYKAGFFFHRSGAKGQLYWAYDNFGRDPFSDFDSAQGDHAAIYINGGKIISTLQWEAIREGIDDFRYLRTLEQALAKHPEHPAAAGAKALLQELWQETVVDLDVYAQRFGKDIEVHHKCIWEPERFDYYRDKITAAILAFK